MRFYFGHLHLFLKTFSHLLREYLAVYQLERNLLKRALESPRLLSCFWKRLREFICQKDSEFSPRKLGILDQVAKGTQVFRLLSLCQPAGWVARGQPDGQAGRILGRNLTQRQGCFKNLPTFDWDFTEISKFLRNVMMLAIWYFPFLWKINAYKILKKIFLSRGHSGYAQKELEYKYFNIAHKSSI